MAGRIAFSARIVQFKAGPEDGGINASSEVFY
jgi:hypothetical protein